MQRIKRTTEPSPPHSDDLATSLLKIFGLPTRDCLELGLDFKPDGHVLVTAKFVRLHSATNIDVEEFSKEYIITPKSASDCTGDEES